MFAITHKIKNALQNKDYILITTENSKIFAGWLNVAECYTITVNGMSVYFDTYQFVNGSIWMNRKSVFVGSFSEDKL